MKFPKKFLLRMILFMVVSVIAAAVISEVGFRIQKNTLSRDPTTVIIVIPPGTAAKVAQGENVIPAGQVFVQGDTLEVKNEDSVTHTLGPLVIPPGTTASMKLNQVGSVNYTCSFQPTKFYGITIQQGLSFGLRFEAALLIGLPLGMLLGLYSFLVIPLEPKTTDSSPSKSPS
jgi:energy-coupling factor transporter transmembrane protein EcfT